MSLNVPSISFFFFLFACLFYLFASCGVFTIFEKHKHSIRNSLCFSIRAALSTIRYPQEKSCALFISLLLAPLINKFVQIELRPLIKKVFRVFSECAPDESQLRLKAKFPIHRGVRLMFVLEKLR